MRTYRAVFKLIQPMRVNIIFDSSYDVLLKMCYNSRQGISEGACMSEELSIDKQSLSEIEKKAVLFQLNNRVDLVLLWCNKQSKQGNFTQRAIDLIEQDVDLSPLENSSWLVNVKSTPSFFRRAINDIVCEIHGILSANYSILEKAIIINNPRDEQKRSRASFGLIKELFKQHARISLNDIIQNHTAKATGAVENKLSSGK